MPQDSNGKLDVYEWELPATPAEAEKGENSCTTSSPDFHASEEGCVLPVSDVAGDYESHFMDAGASGNDVFIATTDQLVPSDKDTREDVYDVKVGGGFPVATAASACTNADSCKPPASPQPAIFGAPASATFSGPGNPVPLVTPPAAVKVPVKRKAVKCKKAKRLVHGKCLSKKTKRARARTPGNGRK